MWDRCFLFGLQHHFGLYNDIYISSVGLNWELNELVLSITPFGDIEWVESCYLLIVGYYHLNLYVLQKLQTHWTVVHSQATMQSYLSFLTNNKTLIVIYITHLKFVLLCFQFFLECFCIATNWSYYMDPLLFLYIVDEEVVFIFLKSSWFSISPNFKTIFLCKRSTLLVIEAKLLTSLSKRF